MIQVWFLYRAFWVPLFKFYGPQKPRYNESSLYYVLVLIEISYDRSIYI